MASPAAEMTGCPHCGAQYKLVRVELTAKDATTDPAAAKVTCKNCGGELKARDGALALKWFLISPRSRRARKT